MERQKETLGGEVETAKEPIYLGDSVSTGGGYQAGNCQYNMWVMRYWMERRFLQS